MRQSQEGAACEVAHGHGAGPTVDRTLIAVFISPVAEYLMRYASDAGFRVVLVEPDMARAGPSGPGVIR